ncbi:unnamed protein product [Paramecium sonneborni]|uniref:Transmembrane protein n=1 Tax=Paramecium sonneborni TaxID=65129 RepID=A0A8S1N139_9CILI|nr:unnamed protein product [Paramecium sonneborni]
MKKNVYNDYFQYYFVYNLDDYTARSLVEQIEIEKKKNELIITYPISNLMDSFVVGSSISLTLIITEKKFEIYYLNQKVEFIFHLQKQFIPFYNDQPFVLMIGVFQPERSKTLYRNYTLVYNFSSTQISFAYNNSSPYKVKINSDKLTTTGGFYQYLFLVDQSYFNGPIVYYNHSNEVNISVIPSPYLQMNKYLGNYMIEVQLYGEITQIIDLGDEIYIGLYNQQIEHIAQYADLIIVLTDFHVLFYQKKSIPDINISCTQTNYTQNFSNDFLGLCSIRLIQIVQLKQIDQNLYCQMQLNGVNALIIVCQLKYFYKLSGRISFINRENTQQFIYLEYSYVQRNNSVIIKKIVTNDKQFCYCFFSDLQPFVYNHSVYQMVKTEYQQINSYFGIYQIVLTDNQTITFIQNSSYPNQNNSQPFQYAEDFALSIIEYQSIQYLYLIILQPENIFIQVINLTDGFPINGSGQNLIFLKQEEYVRFEKAVFIQTLNHFQPHIVNNDNMVQTLMVGNNNQIYEIIFNVTTFEAKLQYTFYQYMLCHHNFLSRPQIELQYQNDSIFYLISQCLSNQFEYQSIQVEMSYLLNELNTNIIYTSLFIRNYTLNYSRPVEILEPYLVNPEELHFQKIQLYQIKDKVKKTSKSHLLITNSTFFLIDLILYFDNGYFLYYPIAQVNDDKDHSIFLNITAYNSYSNCQVQFEIYWTEEDIQINNMAWFYAILSLLLFLIFIVILVVIYGFCQKQNKLGRQDHNLHLERIGDDQSEFGVELQNAPYNQLMLGDVFKDLLRNNKSKKQAISYADELSD